MVQQCTVMAPSCDGRRLVLDNVGSMTTATVYLDHAASTPLDGRVLDTMLPFMREGYGNAASPHARGRAASAAIEEARGAVALALGADPREIVLTSGATEANNLALKGVASAAAHARLPRRIITCVTEHPRCARSTGVTGIEPGVRGYALGRG